MDSRTQERVERWDSRPFRGGRDGLSDLADEGFSGAVTAAGSWLFMLNGRVVGVVGGELEDFETSGTVYVAPDPSLPLLAAMEARGGETRARYYTNETPLTEVDETLQSGSFTGYVELSEQVLSGDYYLVYYGGRQLAAAYIGNAERLLTGDEAFERAADEVGIYEVVDVDVEVTDLRKADDETSETDASPAPGEESPGDDTDSEDVPERSPDPSSVETTNASAGIAARETATAPGEPETPVDETAPSASIADAEPEPATEADSDAVPVEPESEPDGADSSDSGPDLAEIEAAAAELEKSGISWETEETDEPGDSDEDRTASGAESDLEERFEREEQWRETRSIPSIDPDNTSDSASSGKGRSSGTTSSAGDRGDSNSSRADRSGTGGSSRQRPNDGGTDSSGGRSERTDRPEANDGSSPRRIAKLEERLETVRAERDELESERDRLRSENQSLSSTIDRLRDRIDELESELERVRSTGETGAAPAGAGMSPDRALAETNLFVRYDSKSRPTLETAHGGEADRDEVASNLRLEHHTTFEASDVSVAGEAYEEFLTASMEYRFVDWLTGTLLYEIRDTGKDSGLGDLYDAIPRIDRAELGGTVSLADDDTEDVPDEVTFDVVAFDKRGNPLVVANLDDSRDPASRGMLEDLEEHASAVGANYPDLGAAFAVTSSFFQPGALEVTEQATSGGFLSRSAKLGYVNLSRKRGYHLCLVEARSGGFHMNVPEL